MGTLYDLLGALPSDDAESLRTAFRKAAKAKHPDINPDDPDAALKFRELVRAYDILMDADQRATYDELLTIALQPPASKSARIYGSVRKLASNTIAATIISGFLIGGYAFFGQVQMAPGAAEIVTGATTNQPAKIAAAALPGRSAQNEPGSVREGTKSTDATTVAAAVATSPHDGGALAIRQDPGLAEACVDRGAGLFHTHESNRAFAGMAQVKRMKDQGRPKIPLPVPRKATPVRLRAPAKWTPMIAATTP
jgi:curved DNA-binding protein CbpA